MIRGDNNSRNALVLFRNASEANKAIGHAKTKLLFGAAIEASLYDGEGKSNFGFGLEGVRMKIVLYSHLIEVSCFLSYFFNQVKLH